MTRSLVIRAAAEAEMAEAFDWYEARVPGLGSDFLLSVDAALNAIARNPRQYAVIHKNIRRALTRRFPYEVFFIAEKTHIVILAVFHASRNPRDWQEKT